MHQSTATEDPRWFCTTHWSVIISAKNDDSSQASEALDKLCSAYWRPLYSYILRQGHSHESAEDLTQAFFEKLLKKNSWARADPNKGRFRSFLLTVLKQFLADEKDRARTIKRGGRVSFVSFDEQAGEERFVEEPGHHLTGEQEFDRQWALAVLAQARLRLREECIASGKLALYDRVSLIDGQHEGSLPYAVMAQELGMGVGAIKSAVSRLRERYGQFVREAVAHTVSSPAELENEIRYLLTVIGT